jgi:hypothetical protein
MRSSSRFAAFACHAADLHDSARVAGAFQARMIARDVRARVKHEARVLFALRKEAGEISFEGERRRLPLDAFLDACVRTENDLANPEHHIVV